MKKYLLLFLFAVTASGSLFLNSFNSGILSPDMKFRFDVDKRSMGLEEMENMLVRPQGMGYKRPGTEFIDDSNSLSNIRLIPFEYSTSDVYVLELGHKYISFLRTE